MEYFQDTVQDTKQPPKIPPFHLSKQSPEIISQKVDCSDEFERHGAQPFKVVFAYMSSDCSFAPNGPYRENRNKIAVTGQMGLVAGCPSGRCGWRKSLVFYFRKRATLILGGLCLLWAHPAPAVEFSVNGDARTSFYSLDRDDRNGKEESTHELRFRPRVGIGAKFNERWRMQVRFAGRYSTDGSKLHFEIFDNIPAQDGLRQGDSTLDEIYVEYRPDNTWELRVGRFQSKALLSGVAGKSLDREDSAFTNITWTDGVQVKHKAASGWNTTAIAQYNYAQGATQLRRAPLDFREDASRVSYFISLENTLKVGPFVQRTVDITWLPEALHSRGAVPGIVKDYWAAVGRLAAQWPIRGNMKFMLAGELGYAPITPKRSAIGTGTSGSADGLAIQVTFNFIDIVPRHSLGFVLARIGDGWLLAPTFNDNVYQAEVRYKWDIYKNQTLEARMRYNEDIRQRTNAIQKREDLDYFLRYTFTF